MSNRKTKRLLPRSGRGAIVLIVAMLFASSAIRMTIGMGAALASDAPADEVGAEREQIALPASDDRSEAQGTSRDGRQTQPRLKRSEMADLLEALKEREARTNAREQKMEQRAKALKIANQEIEKRLSTLTQAEATLRATLALADSAAENDLSRLTTVYENMKPKDAAALFEEMDPGFAAGFLGRMRPDVAAAVMAGLTPDKAYSVSVILAGRNANVPKT